MRRAASSSPAMRACRSRSARRCRSASASVPASSVREKRRPRPCAGDADVEQDAACGTREPAGEEQADEADRAGSPTPSSAAPARRATSTQAADREQRRLDPRRRRSGRRRYAPSKICSRTCAWISTPGMRSPSGVVLKSSRPRPVTPTSTSLPRRSSGGALPASTSSAETKRSGVVRGRNARQACRPTACGTVHVADAERHALAAAHRSMRSTGDAGGDARSSPRESAGTITCPMRATSGTRRTICLRIRS